MKKIEEKMLISILSKIEEAQNQIQALNFACKDLRNKDLYYSNRNVDTSSYNEYRCLYLSLYKKLVDNYSQMFFMSLFSDEIREKAKLMAYEEFFAEKFNWNVEASFPSFDYLQDSDLKEKFREEIRKSMISEIDKLSPSLQKIIREDTVKKVEEALKS